MKKIYTLLLLVMAGMMPWASSAAPVKVEKAKAVAVDFFAQSTSTRAAASLELVWDGNDATTRSGEEPAFYVFNRTDAPGFVIVAGDDASAPILGYSFDNSFGDPNRMPAHMQWWFNGYAEMILAARAAGMQPDGGWVSPKAGTPIRELKTAIWDQGAPFNLECPTVPGGKAVSGCVQTAGGIVMKYHKWPTNVSGTIPGYTSRPHNISMPARTLSPYNWDLMIDDYTGGYSSEQGAEVARLMVDLGTGNKASYDLATGAFTHFLINTLASYMGYNKQMRMAMRDGYSNEQWAALIRNEVDNNGPVIYSGVDPKQGGHAFVLDGYADDGTFRFNWGWSGSGNGYYTVTALGPSGSNFSEQQEIIVGLYPDKSGSTAFADDLKLATLSYSDGSLFYGFETSTNNFVKGESFTVEAGYINMSARPYSGRVGVAVYGQNGAMKELLCEQSQNLSAAAANGQLFVGDIYKTCKITQNIARGDRLRVVFWDNGKKAWHPMDGFDNTAVTEIIISPETLDAKSIAAGTTIAYDRATKRLILQTFAELTYKIVAADGKTVQSGNSTGKAVAFEMAAGSYTLTITDPAAEIDGTYAVRLKF